MSEQEWKLGELLKLKQSTVFSNHIFQWFSQDSRFLVIQKCTNSHTPPYNSHVILFLGKKDRNNNNLCVLKITQIEKSKFEKI